MFRPGRMGRRVTAVSERIFPELCAIVDAAAAAEDASRTKSSYFGIPVSTAAAPADARALALELALLPDLLPGGVSIFDESIVRSTLGLKALALPGTFLDSESPFGGNRGSGGANEPSLSGKMGISKAASVSGFSGNLLRAPPPPGGGCGLRDEEAASSSSSAKPSKYLATSSKSA